MLPFMVTGLLFKFEALFVWLKYFDAYVGVVLSLDLCNSIINLSCDCVLCCRCCHGNSYNGIVYMDLEVSSTQCHTVCCLYNCVSFHYRCCHGDPCNTIVYMDPEVSSTQCHTVCCLYNCVSFHYRCCHGDPYNVIVYNGPGGEFNTVSYCMLLV